MIELARPLALLGLVLPLALWWLARERAHVRTHTSAIWDWWPQRAANAPSGARRRTPTWARWLVAALFALVLALAGPRRAVEPASWRVVLDERGALDLPVRVDGPTRREVVLDECAVWLASVPASTSVQWIRARSAPLDLRAGDGVPRDWRAPNAFASHAASSSVALTGSDVERDALELAAYDTPRTLWLLARAPDPPPYAAAWFASGGAAAPGLVARDARDGVRMRWLYDGRDVRGEPDPDPPRVLAIAADVPARLTELARLWAEQRGFAVVRADATDATNATPATTARDETAARFHVEPSTMRARTTLLAQRDGWSAELAGALHFARARDDAFDWPLDGTDGTQLSCVRAAPNDIELAFDTLAEPNGDPASFALSWSRLFDAAWSHAPDEIALAQRAEQGDGTDRSPQALDEHDPSNDDSIAVALALLAALCSLLAAYSWRASAARATAAALDAPTTRR